MRCNHTIQLFDSHLSIAYGGTLDYNSSRDKEEEHPPQGSLFDNSMWSHLQWFSRCTRSMFFRTSIVNAVQRHLPDVVGGIRRFLYEM